MKRPWIAAMGLSVLFMLPGCSSQKANPPEANQPKVQSPELLTGRTAFQKLYVAARGWSGDVKPYRLESQTSLDSNGQDGKAALWRASFGSIGRAATREFMWSGSVAKGAPPPGIAPGAPDSYTPGNSSTQVFELPFLKIDSDHAYDLAQKHGGDKVLAKSPNTPVLYVLEWSGATSNLIWYVVYGNSRNDAVLTVAVNASDGVFIRTEK